MTKAERKRIIRVLTNLLTDFEDEVNQNTEWKLGDAGSWTKNIRQSKRLLKDLKK